MKVRLRRNIVTILDLWPGSSAGKQVCLAQIGRSVAQQGASAPTVVSRTVKRAGELNSADAPVGSVPPQRPEKSLSFRQKFSTRLSPPPQQQQPSTALTKDLIGRNMSYSSSRRLMEDDIPSSSASTASAAEVLYELDGVEGKATTQSRPTLLESSGTMLDDEDGVGYQQAVKSALQQQLAAQNLQFTESGVLYHLAAPKRRQGDMGDVPSGPPSETLGMQRPAGSKRDENPYVVDEPPTSNVTPATPAKVAYDLAVSTIWTP